MNAVQIEAVENFVDQLMKNSTPNQPAWNLEARIEKKEPAWNYIDGCMIKAILELYDATKNKKYLDFAKEYISFFIKDKGMIKGYYEGDYNCDQINEGKVLFPLFKYTEDEKYKKAIQTLYNQVLNQPKTESGNFWHKKIYPNQIWLDGLYMVQPFYMEYEMTFNQMRHYKDIFNQFEQVHNIMRDKETKLLYHGYDEKRESLWADKETGLSKNFWTRSIGWYTMALVDTIEKLDEQMFYEYMKLQEYLKEILDALLEYKDTNSNMFYQVTNKGGLEGNYLETSGTCAIAYSLMKGARLNYLPKYYFDYGMEIFNAVLESKLDLNEEQFVLKDICLVAGLGGMPGKGSYKVRDGSYEYYISEPVVSNDAKGVAPFLFAFCEALRKNSLK